MRDLNDLYYFSQVVEHGGFSAAARALDLPKSKLSRRIAQLEADLDVRLLQRTTRRLNLTAAGERYLSYCREISSSARAADEAIRQLRAEPSGPVLLSCPVAIAQQALAPLLPEFLDTWPAVKLQVLVTNRRVDIIREGVDLALRVRTVLDTDGELIVKRLGTGGLQLVASPAYVQRFGKPETPEDLAEHATLCFADTGGIQHWHLDDGKGQSRTVMHQPRLCCNDFPVLVEAAVRGRGIALLPEMTTRDELRRGRLLQVLPQWQSPQGILHCIYPSRRGMVPAVRALLDFLSERLPPVYAATRGAGPS